MVRALAAGLGREGGWQESQDERRGHRDQHETLRSSDSDRSEVRLHGRTTPEARRMFRGRAERNLGLSSRSRQYRWTNETGFERQVVRAVTMDTRRL